MISKSFRKFSKVFKSFQKFSKVFKSFQKFSKVFKSFQKFSKVNLNSNFKLRLIIKIFNLISKALIHIKHNIYRMNDSYARYVGFSDREYS
jgi:hypothetical protein